MIFVTVGQEKFPFDRLLRMIDEGIEKGEIHQPVFGQTGHSRYVPERFAHEKFLPLDRMQELIRKSEIVVTHGGVGSVVFCLNSGKIPLVVPREKGLGEHLDDHQIEFTRMMENEGHVIVSCHQEDFFYKIKNFERLVKDLPNRRRPQGKARLLQFLSGVIEGFEKKKNLKPGTSF